MQTKQYDQVILFGDSITEWSSNMDSGFVQPALQMMWSRRLDVINRGFSGYNTAHGLHVLPRMFPPPPRPTASAAAPDSTASTEQTGDDGGSGSGSRPLVRLLVIFFGANDSCLPDNPTGQHVPLAEYKENLKSMARHPAVRAHAPRIVIVTPPPVDERRMAESGYDEGGRTAEHTALYAAAAREAAQELAGGDGRDADGGGAGRDVVCCDLWHVFMRKANGGSDQIPRPLPGDERAPDNAVLRKLLSDGLHFNPPAYELMFEALRDAVFDAFPELDPENMPPVFPYWREAPKI